MNCSCCQSRDLVTIYETGKLPIFQNKVYTTRELAEAAERGQVMLLHCNDCGFVFNGCFNPDLMTYDGEYQNEQAHSLYFDRYLDSLVQLFGERGFADQRIIEIGCGKGTFLQKLWDAGFEAFGFDKTYEGTDPRVIQDYFSEQYQGHKADLYILRHTLEHIQNPLQFLQEIAELADFQGSVYIEVPSFEWILQHNAFWDIFYEHCNYFTLASIQNFFSGACGDYLFKKQYLYVLAPFSGLKSNAGHRNMARTDKNFELRMEQERLIDFVRQRQDLVVWGAGAKGSTFVNITDAAREHIRCLVDVNPNKAGNYVAGSGHQIVSPEALPDQPLEILIMNDNYLEEIRALNRGRPYRYYSLGEDLK